MRQALLALVAIGLAASLAGAGTVAFFNDTETSEGNILQAGTLDLKVGGSTFEDDPSVVSVTLSDMKPGDKVWYMWTLKNVGSIPGQPSVEFSTITNNENGCTEPEISEDDTEDTGELGRYINASIWNGLTPKSWWYSNPLNVFGGKIFGGLTDPTYKYPAIGQNEQVKFVLELQLPATVGNVIQSDSVEFDIVFRLEQA